MYPEITLIAFMIDKLFCKAGLKNIKHPIVLMGDYIKWFEKYFYQDSIILGIILNLTLLLITFIITFILNFLLPWYLLAPLASLGIASSMLYASVKEIITNPQSIKYLVSRDTNNLSKSDINKAAIETYGENLSDGVIAPLFYLLLFGIIGLFIYKAINTLDSMVGYKNQRYEKFGKFSAKLDDIANFIPSRITAFLIALLFWSKKSFQSIFLYAKLHESPNAGYPIAAIAGAIDVTLGGDTFYFNKLKKKAKFGDGKEVITQQDITNALSLQPKLDIFIIFFLAITLFIQ